jgi:hypothetical protein
MLAAHSIRGWADRGRARCVVFAVGLVVLASPSCARPSGVEQPRLAASSNQVLDPDASVSAGPSALLSKPSPTADGARPADSDAATASCDDIVRSVRAKGGIGLMSRHEPSLDPLCDWRIADANAEAMGSGAGVAQTTGRVDPVVVMNLLRTKRAAVAECVKEIPEARPALRVRVAFDASGVVTSVLTDYRVTLPTAAVSCVTGVLAKLRIVNPPSEETVVFGFDVER